MGLNARVVLGVSGGISAYKSVDLASKLVQLGLRVDVAMTETASHFVGPASFEAITGNHVHIGVLESWTSDFKGHVSLGAEADLLVVAPATANTIARLAYGLADDMLTSAALAATCPLMVAPSMEHSMFHHPATQENLRTLVQRGATVVGPREGRLASGEFGAGRMSEPIELVGWARYLLGRNGPLRGRKIVVTAGGTTEPLDPIRFLGNRSSGRMGYAVAQVALDKGADVTLITGPSCLTPPWGCDVIEVQTAIEMQNAVARSVTGAAAIVMSAAVSDYRPASISRQKIKKSEVGDSLDIRLEQNPDIIGSIDEPGLIKIGFAAETERLVDNAIAKLEAKQLDLVVANDAESTIGAPTNRATLVSPGGEIEALDEMPKAELADVILTRLVGLLQTRA